MKGYNLEVKMIYAKFFMHRNGATIFTEGSLRDKPFLSNLYKRLFSDTDLIINDITPLGGRDELIEACEIQNSNSKNRDIFILNGGINIINRITPPDFKNLHTLDAYCMENYVIDKHSVLNLIKLEQNRMTLDKINEKIEYDEWLEGISESLIDLFLHYSICEEYQVSYKILNSYRFVKKSDSIKVLDINKIDTHKSKIVKSILSNISSKEFEEKLKERRDKWQYTSTSLLKVVSGKEYLLPLLLFKIHGIGSSRDLSVDGLRLILAKNCRLNNLSRIKKVILNN